VIARARTLGAPVVARGVEEQAHLERLEAAGCEWFETHLLAGPLDLEATVELLQRG
jgi:EAL domain-containing protein (putative c-di-GMP-specific phosphodiesterase class I)